MRYTSGYKYQVYEDFSVHTIGLWAVKRKVVTQGGFIELCDGLLTIRKGYAWDGPSGPTWDTRSAMRGSCAHDAIYQLIRAGLLPTKPSRRRADLLFWELIRCAGLVSSVRQTRIVFQPSRLAASSVALPATTIPAALTTMGFC